jgi:hypothetical protein
LTAVYLLLSLPLLDTQVAIPGNADLWMATVYGLAAFSFFNWLRSGDERQARLALAMALACALIKVPGVLWALTFLPALLLRVCSRRRLLVISALIAVALGAVLSIGLRLRLPVLGAVTLTRDMLELPYLGRYPLGPHPEALPALAQSAFSLASWHLLWYGLCALGLLRWRTFTDRATAPMATLAVSSLAFVGAVYTMSPLAEHAVDYTQANRTALHIVPMLLFVALTAWRGPEAVIRPRGRA